MAVSRNVGKSCFWVYGLINGQGLCYSPHNNLVSLMPSMERELTTKLEDYSIKVCSMFRASLGSTMIIEICHFVEMNFIL